MHACMPDTTTGEFRPMLPICLKHWHPILSLLHTPPTIHNNPDGCTRTAPHKHPRAAGRQHSLSKYIWHVRVKSTVLPCTVAQAQHFPVIATRSRLQLVPPDELEGCRCGKAGGCPPRPKTLAPPGFAPSQLYILSPLVPPHACEVGSAGTVPRTSCIAGWEKEGRHLVVASHSLFLVCRLSFVTLLLHYLKPHAWHMGAEWG